MFHYSFIMAFTNDNKTAPSLTFPCDIFATLAPNSFLEAHLQQSSTPNSSKATRPNGRNLSEFRPVHLNTGSLSHASGSAVVRLGNTAAVAGVRPEILRVQDIPSVPKLVKYWKPDRGTITRWLDYEKNDTKAKNHDRDQVSQDDEVTTLGLIVPNVEISTACVAQSGNSPGRTAQDLTQRILELIQSVGLVQADDLRLTYKPPIFDDADAETELGGSDKESNEQVVAYWVLYIDIVFISLDGAAFDAAWNATVAALKNLLLPQATWDAELNNVVCDIDKSKSRRLSLHGAPLVTTFAAFKGAAHDLTMGQNKSIGVEGESDRYRIVVLADPDTFEESVCDEVITVVIDCTGGALKILWLEKWGGSIVGRSHVRNLVLLAEDQWGKLNQEFASADV